MEINKLIEANMALKINGQERSEPSGAQPGLERSGGDAHRHARKVIVTSVCSDRLHTL